MVIPATKFTTTLSKLGYFGIKRMTEKVKVNYSSFTIFEASDLKEILEGLEINTEGVIISPLDNVNMYPPIKLTATRKAVK